MMPRSSSVSDVNQHRLFGGINRIAWRPEDVSAIVARFGGATDHIHMPQQSRDYLASAAPVWEKLAGDSSRTFTFTISSATVDRMGDSIAVDGWRLDNFKRNPVVLWGHDGSMLPV